MGFKIRVGNESFEWFDQKLVCSSHEKMQELIESLKDHIPTVLALPDLIDYDDDLTNGRNAYYTILGSFKECEVVKKPSEDFLGYGYVEGRIY